MTNLQPNGTRSMLPNILRMPAPLLILFCVFLLLPFWSLTFVELPWDIYARGDALASGVVAFAYFLGPLLILITTALRSIAFLPMLVVECLALILHTVLNFQNQTVEFQSLRYVLLGAMAASGIFVFNRDTLYPFMSKNARFWRRSQRIATNAKLHLLIEDQRHPVMLQDISLTGMGLIGTSPEVLAILKDTGKDDRLLFSIRQEGEDLRLESKLSWSTGHGDTRQFGVRVADSAVMAKVIGGLNLNSGGSKFSQFVVKNWAKSGFRRAVLSVWGLTLAGSFGVPACGTGHDSNSKRTARLDQGQSRLAEVEPGGVGEVGDVAANFPELASQMTIDIENGWVQIPIDDPEVRPSFESRCDGMMLDSNENSQINVLADMTCPITVNSVEFDGVTYVPKDEEGRLVFYLKSQEGAVEILFDGVTKPYFSEGLGLQSQGSVNVGLGANGVTVKQKDHSPKSTSQNRSEETAPSTSSTTNLSSQTSNATITTTTNASTTITSTTTQIETNDGTGFKSCNEKQKGWEGGCRVVEIDNYTRVAGKRLRPGLHIINHCAEGYRPVPDEPILDSQILSQTIEPIENGVNFHECCCGSTEEFGEFRVACVEKFGQGATECNEGCCLPGYSCNSHNMCDLVKLCGPKGSKAGSDCATLEVACGDRQACGIGCCGEGRICNDSNSLCYLSPNFNFGESATTAPISLAPNMIGD
jgi:hypothetical protein